MFRHFSHFTSTGTLSFNVKKLQTELFGVLLGDKLEQKFTLEHPSHHSQMLKLNHQILVAAKNIYNRFNIELLQRRFLLIKKLDMSVPILN